MIKRLKWNVLYGGGDGEESDSSLSSDSEAEGAANPQELLEQLVKNDPFLNKFNDSDTENGADSSEIDSEPENSENSGVESWKTKEDISLRGSAFRICELCNKKLLNEKDVESHLKSRKHQATLRNIEKGKEESILDTATKEERGGARTEDENHSKKRKEAAKRKLKKLKERKWKRQRGESTEQVKSSPKDKSRRDTEPVRDGELQQVNSHATQGGPSATLEAGKRKVHGKSHTELHQKTEKNTNLLRGPAIGRVTKKRHTKVATEIETKLASDLQGTKKEPSLTKLQKKVKRRCKSKNSASRANNM